MVNTAFDKANAEFWNELCGSSFAKSIGINDFSAGSLRRFDDAYLGLYPYLLRHVDLSRMLGKKVLEVGLGWGTLGQKIAEAGAEYIGLDVAPGPVRMMIHRLRMAGIPGNALQGSMLRCPLSDDTMDYVVSIGCFHHTGDVERCVREAYRVLKQGGTAIVMVYNRFSYRQWLGWPGTTLMALLQDFGLSRTPTHSTKSQRKAYDSDLQGNAAPETTFLTTHQLRDMFRPFSRVRVEKENVGGRLSLRLRGWLLPNVAKVVGLDLYITAQK